MHKSEHILVFLRIVFFVEEKRVKMADCLEGRFLDVVRCGLVVYSLWCFAAIVMCFRRGIAVQGLYFSTVQFSDLNYVLV